jgi:hypothetical protein
MKQPKQLTIKKNMHGHPGMEYKLGLDKEHMIIDKPKHPKQTLEEKLKQEQRNNNMATQDPICQRCNMKKSEWQKKGILCNLQIESGRHTFQVTPMQKDVISRQENKQPKLEPKYAILYNNMRINKTFLSYSEAHQWGIENYRGEVGWKIRRIGKNGKIWNTKYTINGKKYETTT